MPEDRTLAWPWPQQRPGLVAQYRTVLVFGEHRLAVTGPGCLAFSAGWKVFQVNWQQRRIP